MNVEEFSNQFDVLYNNITSNQAPGLTEYEKSVFLTKAQNEIVKNYFTANSKGNNIGQGFDDSAKRQADFSCLMKTTDCIPGTSSDGYGLSGYIVKYSTNSGTWIQLNATKTQFAQIASIGSIVDFPTGYAGSDVVPGEYAVTKEKLDNNTDIKYVIFKTNGGERIKATVGSSFTSEPAVSLLKRIDSRSTIFEFPNDVFISINEAAITLDGDNLQVVPLRYDEYLRLMSKPYKRPLKWQAWRLINSGEGTASAKYVELICGPNDTIADYSIRYIRFPRPIILGYLDGLTINGEGTTTECELDPIIHEDILQRAVELAKIAWTANGQDNLQPVITAGQRSE